MRLCGFKSRPRHQIGSRATRGDVAKWLRRRSAKPLFGGSNPPVASKGFADQKLTSRGGGMVDAADLKSATLTGV